jgi:hypothetical protein
MSSATGAPLVGAPTEQSETGGLAGSRATPVSPDDNAVGWGGSWLLRLRCCAVAVVVVS